MKKSILKLLLVIFGLNVFTSCYGMPPGEWPEPVPEQTPEQVRASYDVQEEADPEEEETNEDNQSE